MFIETQFTIAKIRKQPKCPSAEEWIKSWHVYISYMYRIYMEYYQAIKKNEILPFAATWMEIDNLCLVKYVR